MGKGKGKEKYWKDSPAFRKEQGSSWRAGKLSTYVLERLKSNLRDLNQEVERDTEKQLYRLMFSPPESLPSFRPSV